MVKVRFDALAAKNIGTGEETPLMGIKGESCTITPNPNGGTDISNGTTTVTVANESDVSELKEEVDKANVVINGTGIEISDFSVFERTKRNWLTETSATGVETYIESDYETEGYYNIIIPNNNYDNFMFSKTSDAGGYIAFCNDKDVITKAFRYPESSETTITNVSSSTKYFILKAQTEKNFIPKSIIFNKRIGIADDYLSKNASGDQVLTCRLKIGTPTLNLSNAFLHMRYIPSVVDERGRSLYGACFAVGLNGCAELQTKSYNSSGTAARNEAVMRIGRNGVEYAPNLTSSNVPPESAYKELAVADNLSLMQDENGIALKYKDAEISRVDEGKFELIEDIVLSEDVSTIQRTAEPNGTPYNFKAIYIWFNLKPATNSSSFNCAGNNKTLFNYYGAIKNEQVYGYLDSEISHGMIRTLAPASLYSFENATAAVQRANLNPLNLFGNSNFYKLQMSAIKISGDGEGYIPAGSNIKIYGVRA